MRFLLNAPRSRSTTSIHQNAKNKIKLASSSESNPNPNRTNTNAKTRAEVRAWGQQCSPNCGCTIRFEAILDSTNNHRIVSASYDAKTILTQVQNVELSNGQMTSFLKPVRTMSNRRTMASRSSTLNSRPMVKECKCPTLHGLAKTITEALPNYSLSQAQNQMEYVGIRSSPAFRYSALKHLNLILHDQHHHSSSSKKFSFQNSNKQLLQSHISPNANEEQPASKSKPIHINHIPEGRCYDLVEEALMACLHGYIPKPRPSSSSFYQYPYSHGHGHVHGHGHGQGNVVHRVNYRDDNGNENNDQERNGYLDPLRFVTAAKRRAKEGFFHSFHPSSSSSQGNHHHHTSSLPSSSSSSSSSMPPFHLMANPSSDDGQEHIDTLTQIKMEIQSMNDKDDERNRRDEYAAWNDWVSYVDEKYDHDHCNARLD